MAYNPYYNNLYTQPMLTQNGAMPDAFAQMKAPYQPMVQPAQQPTQTNNEFLWVLNEVEAQSYPVAPNNTVTLWDKTNPTIYIKSANAQGVPSMRILDFTERSQNSPPNAQNQALNLGDNFVTLEQFNDLKGQFEDLKRVLDSTTQKKTTKATKGSDE